MNDYGPATNHANDPRNDDEPMYAGDMRCPFCGSEAEEDGHGWIWCAGRRACGWGETL